MTAARRRASGGTEMSSLPSWLHSKDSTCTLLTLIKPTVPPTVVELMRGTGTAQEEKAMEQASVPASPQGDALGGSEDEVEVFGYQQHFKRTLHSYASFAIAFSFISITSGIFTTFAFFLGTSGPVGLWMWIPAVAGQFLVALIYAQLAARIPLSGYSYQWASRLANPKIGWGYGWVSFAYLAIVGMTVNYSMTEFAIVPLFNISPTIAHIQLVSLICLIVEALILVFSTQIASRINSVAVGTEVIGIVGLTVVLLLAVLFGSKGSVSNLWSKGLLEHHASYWAFNGPFMLALLLGAYTVVGFESSANLAEETHDPRRVIPPAMLRAVWISGIVGLLFLIALVVALPNVDKFSTNPSPITAIVQSQVGTTFEKIFLVFVTFSLLANAMIIMLTGSRVVYAMSRDSRFPGYQLFNKVPARLGTPMWCVLLMFVIGLVLLYTVGGSPTALGNLAGASTILPAIVYFATVLLYIGVRNKLHSVPGMFSLGRWENPVIVLSLLWLSVELIVLVFPSVFWTAVKLSALCLVIGAVLFVAFRVFTPHVFEHEPGAAVLETPEADTPPPGTPTSGTFVGD